MPSLSYSQRPRQNPSQHSPALQKAALVQLGLSALGRGDWTLVRLISIALQGGGLRHV
jgi:hypothetical protein